MNKRSIYLQTTALEEAVPKYLSALEGRLKPVSERIAVRDALKRVTSTAVYARYCSPLYNSAAMDGIAVRSEDTVGASEKQPLELRRGEHYREIDTGDPLPFPYDAVIMIENLLAGAQEGRVRIVESIAAWENVRPVGEDIVAGEMILPSGHAVRPMDIAVLLSAGLTELEVYKRPRVTVLPTGSELIEADASPALGDIIESNSGLFIGRLEELGALPKRLAIVPDDYALLREKILEAAATSELVLVSAGSSAGSEDHTVHVLREIGEVYIHGVAIKPGKPVILARVHETPVIGLPGYPVSAYIAFEKFVLPILEILSGLPARPTPCIEAILSRRVVSGLQHQEYLRVKLGQVAGRVVATPLSRGAGAAMSLVRADGFCVVPRNSEGYEAGERVAVELSRALDEIENSLVLIGSHDLALDVLADLLPHYYPRHYLSSAHVGSMGGLMALKRGEAHLAPIHLLDEGSGIYNSPIVRELFKGEDMVLLHGLGRVQGLMVKAGNPLNIKTLADLTRVRMVNRQRGAGTRLLLDFQLKQLGVDTQTLKGYGLEMTTHMALAAFVNSEGADTGLGILSAARSMGLDFIPLAVERYDFALRKADLRLSVVQAFIALLKSAEFRERLEALGGYSFERIGEIEEL